MLLHTSNHSTSSEQPQRSSSENSLIFSGYRYDFSATTVINYQKIIWQPGSMQGLSAPQLPICHTKTHARICSHLLYRHPSPTPTILISFISLRFISSKGDFLVGHSDNFPPLPTLPHKLPGGVSTVTGIALHSPGLWAGAQGWGCVYLLVLVCVCARVWCVNARGA